MATTAQFAKFKKYMARIEGARRDPNAPAEDVAHWAECVVQGKRPVLAAEHARHVVEIMEKANVASRSGLAQNLTTTF